MKTVRIGVIGLGVIGACHARSILENKIERAELTAVCDADPEKLAAFPTVKRFADSSELIHSDEVDAVLIATPHYSHTAIGVAALGQSLHVLMEKPISVHKADCEKLIAAHKGEGQVFSAMFNQRTDPHYRKVKKLIDDGELGAIQRVNWIITAWFRTQAYCDSSEWRATWEGEGGGVLTNQSPHQLDLLQWLCGMPSSVRAFCRFGRFHNIEVEDDVTAYMEYPNGATGVFITTTGEAPGTDRLEIVGDRGKVVVEDGAIAFTRTGVSVKEFRETSSELFATPDVWNIDIPAKGQGGQHVEIIHNFVEAILDGSPLIAPAEEGINSVELANAMLYSTLIDATVDLPLDSAAFEAQLNKLRTSRTRTGMNG